MNATETLFTEKPKKVPALTEGEMLDRLRAKYSETAGNGAAYSFIPGVRSAAGFDSRRTIDAYMMSLWPSRGLTLTAFECKSSRSDFQRELKKPEKAEEFCQLADYFYLVTGEKDIVHPGELPETWGLMVPHGKGLKVAVGAPRLRPAGDARPAPLPPSFDRSYLAALLRAATYVASVTPEEIQAAEERARESERKIHQEEAQRWKERFSEEVAQRRAFEEAAGVPLNARWPTERTPRDVGAAVKLVLNGEHDVSLFEERIRRVREQAQEILNASESYGSAELDAPAETRGTECPGPVAMT